MLQGFQKVTCDPAGTRTRDPSLKRALLYQLSYWIIVLFFEATANIRFEITGANPKKRI